MTHPVLRALQQRESGNFEGACRTLKAFLLRQPANAQALQLLGVVHAEAGEQHLAIPCFERALRIAPGDLDTLANLAKAQNETGQFLSALESYDRLLVLRGDDAVTLMDRGVALMRLRRFDESLAAYDASICLAPDFPTVWGNRAHLLALLRRFDEALASAERGLALKADFAEALTVRGIVMMLAKRHAEAARDFERARALKDLTFVPGFALHNRMMVCDWDKDALGFSRLIQQIVSTPLAATAFVLLGTPLPAAQILQCANAEAKYTLGEVPARWQSTAHERPRIRLGYFSSDFNDDHPVGQVIASLIEAHDRDRFEVVGFSIARSGDDPGSPRLHKAFDRFLQVGDLIDRQALDHIRSQEIDVAIDLNGYTRGSRPEFFFERVAPVQVNYLGYPGTMGSGFMDYIVADRWVIPEGDHRHFAEKVITLPECYFPAEALEIPAPDQAQRGREGLPDSGFVFCCFNNSFKIEPTVFDIWMRLLATTEGSVLWLSMNNEEACANLHREALKRGVSPQRIIFAPRLARRAEHLARIGLADLFVDTFYYNAHTTACDALSAGLPVLTCYGETFPGRAAASLLHGLGLPELVAHTHQEYEEKARQFAIEPGALSSLRRRLVENRARTGLFDTRRLTRHLEWAYAQMMDLHRRGREPEAIAVPLEPVKC